MHLGTLADFAYEYIKERILDQRYPLGSRLREDLIAQEIGISRTPVREAINRLSVVGLVRNVPRSGVFVTELTAEEILDLIDLREALETLAIRRATSRITDQQLDDLAENLQEYEKAIMKADFSRCLSLDRSFHEMIGKASNMLKLPQYLDELSDLIQITRALDCRDQETLKRALDEHKSILGALENRDEEASVIALRYHLARVRSRFLQGEPDQFSRNRKS